MSQPTLGPNAPTDPMPLSVPAHQVTARLEAAPVPVDDDAIAALQSACADVTTDAERVVEASRDWWLIAMAWATEGQVPALASVVARPTNDDEVAAIAKVCHERHLPLTVAGGRSGVCGGSVPLYGGVVVDLTGLDEVRSVDDESLLLDVGAGAFGDHLEHELTTKHGLTIGHWPQSIALSTVGGWLACRGAGQFSNRYGKIEDMVVGLDITLADGRRIQTGGHARAAAGPDLNQLFVGSEGTLGIITGARLRLRPAPTAKRQAAYGFTSFGGAIDACRRVLRRGATPAALRHYDPIESQRNFDTDTNVVLVYDEGDPAIIDAAMAIVADEFATADRLDDELVTQWLGHRNDTSSLQPLVEKGFCIDTMEITAPWGRLSDLYDTTTEAMRAVPGAMLVSAHQSHAYTDGACLYFTFAGRPDPGDRDAFYRDMWATGTRAVLAGGGSLSHHHGVGLNRGPFMAEALGAAFDVLVTTKAALDPHGILNPGKLGLPHPFDSNQTPGPW